MRLRQTSSAPLVALLLLPIGLSAEMPDRDPYTDPFVERECDQCSDLCPLVDQYWQKEKGIELWQQFAASTPPGSRTAIPAGITDVDDFENYVAGELNKKLQGRKLPCKTMQESEAERGNKNPKPPRGGIQTGLETKVFQESCDIVYQGQKLEGTTEKIWRSTHMCTGSANAELEHEKVHQRICRATWDANRFLAVKRQSTLRNVAETELQAWKKHRDMLREQIQRLAWKCGWQPTERQSMDPDSVPTETQTKKMQDQGWKAFEALESTPAWQASGA